MFYLKHIITTATLLATINVSADIIVPDTATVPGSQSNNVNQNAAGNAAHFKKGQVVVKGIPADFPGYTIIKTLPHAGLVVLKAEPGKELAEIKKLKGQSKKASLNFILQQFATATDTFYYPYQWNFTTIQAEQAWDISTGSGVKVAVLDTGLQQGGSDGISCVLPGIDIAYGDNNPADGNGHGTHVSGTIAQKTNNIGTAGLAHGACILPVKVLGDTGSGTDADIAEGIAWAVANGARVINMSLGYPAQYTLDQFVGSASYDALHAASKQVTIVVASGNDSSTIGVSYPASHPETIAVGATGYSNLQSYPNIAPYSNQGPALDLVAPGGDMSIDLNGDTYGDGILQETYSTTNGWGHYFFQGTSMAAPHVAAAAAMLISQDDTLDRYQVLQKLTATALDVGVAGRDNVYGYGLIQIHDALSLAPPVTNQAPHAAFSYSCLDLSCGFTSTSSDPEDTTVATTAWDFGDNAVDSPANVQHVFANAGSFAVALTVTDSEGLDNTSIQTITVTNPPVNQAPVASFSTNCINLDCVFTSTSTDDGTITNYAWDINSGEGASNENSVAFVFADSGDSNVKLMVTDNEGAQTIIEKTVTVTTPNVAPIASFTFNCSGFICDFSSTSVDEDGTLIAFNWNFGDGTNASASSVQQKTFLANGEYTVTLTVTDDDNEKVTTSQVVSINVVFLAPSSISAADNADGTATIIWVDENTGATTGFELQRRKLNTGKGAWGNWNTVATTTATTYLDASGKGTFQYQVKALSETGSSDWVLSSNVIVTSASTKGGGGTKGGGETKGGGRKNK